MRELIGLFEARGRDEQFLSELAAITPYMIASALTPANAAKKPQFSDFVLKHE